MFSWGRQNVDDLNNVIEAMRKFLHQVNENIKSQGLLNADMVDMIKTLSERNEHLEQRVRELEKAGASLISLQN